MIDPKHYFANIDFATGELLPGRPKERALTPRVRYSVDQLSSGCRLFLISDRKPLSRAMTSSGRKEPEENACDEPPDAGPHPARPVRHHDLMKPSTPWTKLLEEKHKT